MRPNARNRATAPRLNLSSPPVPAGFAVEQPTQEELQLRETIATARGVRVIESAWPAQPARQTYIAPMPGRGNYNSRGGGGRHPAGNTKNRFVSSSGLGQGEGPSNYPPPKPLGQALGTVAAVNAVGKGRGMVNSVLPRTVPLLYSLPTDAERVATQEARRQEKVEIRNAKREEKRNRNLIRNGYAVVGSSGSTLNIANEPAERVGLGETGGTPNHHSGSSWSSQSSSPPPPPPSPPSLPPQPPPISFQAQQQLNFMSNDWRTWPEISVKVGPGLPLKYTTWDMYLLFADYGAVESIELFENKRGTRDGNARVKFSRVFEPFWNRPFITYLWDNTQCRLSTSLEAPRRKFVIASPVNKNKNYPEKFAFKPKEMDFGFMIEQNSMVAMYTTDETDDITFEVNLYRKQIDVTFNIYLAKEEIPPGSELLPSPDEGEVQAENPEPEQAGRRESYRFRIPFARLSQLMEQGPLISEKDRVFLISLPSPPLFWRKLNNVANSHDHAANFWTIWDMWFRQTGIAFDPLRRSKLPISLRQPLPIIDTGRWTTYRFKFALEPHQIGPFEEMISALKDFNVNTKMCDELRVIHEKPEPIWGSIDVVKTSEFTNSFSDLSEALIPLLLFPTRYQLEVCISQGFLNEYNITPEFIDHLAELPPARAVSLLEHVAEKKIRVYNPMDIFNLGGFAEGTAALKKKKAMPVYCQLVRKATVTPSTVYYTTPTAETSNRVIRHYSEHSDRFLRVQFMDENEGRINSTDKKTMHEVFSRIMTAMESGIEIGDRHFEFLAFGNSQVREHGAYFFASTDHISAADIRAWMGDFRDIRVVAKHAARLGQCYSTTRAIRGVRVDVQEIDDIKYPDNEYCFSDGVGKISDFLCRIIVMELELPEDQPPPSCVQFRLGGCKGVMAVWPDAKMREVFIRPSQRKFQATHNILEVIRTSKFAGAALNRQLIIVLSSLGTADNVFVLKLTEMLANLQDAMHDPAVALSCLCKTIDANQFTLALAAMVRDKFMDFREPFVMSLLGLWRAWSIKYLKEKARITIDKGAFLLGVVDETGRLKGHYEEEEEEGGDTAKGKKTTPPGLPEIFLQIDDPDSPGEFKVITGLCIIARNPSLHPGDIRTVQAVDVPELRHLRNVVVFPNKGDRDLASMLSGGDLDGDDYIVIWDPELTFGVTNHKPMDYSPLEPRTLDRDVTVQDITKFFVNYMRNDKLGTIANAHLAWADSLEEGVKSDQCFRLAALHSDAVDYVKTGEPAEMPRDLRPRKYPHFMEKEPDKTYQSHKILGRLYDMVVKIDFVPSYELKFDDRILDAYVLNEDSLAAARAIKTEYDAALHRIMAQHDIRTEFEVCSTFVMHHSTAAKDYKFHEEIASIRDGLRDSFRKMVVEKVGDRDEEKLGPFIAAMYTVTKQELDAALQSQEIKKTKGKDSAELTSKDIEEMPLISFPWLFPEILGRLANREYPFTNLDNAHDGSFRQYEYEHVIIPDTKRGATRKTGVNDTKNYSYFENEVYDFERDDYTAADDLAGLRIEPACEDPENSSEAYTCFDYNKQDQQNPDCRIIGEGVTKKENHQNSSNGEASDSRNIHDDDGEGLSFCEQLFRDMGPGSGVF